MDNSQIQIVVLSDVTCSVKKYSGSDEVIDMPAEVEKDGKKYQIVEIGVSAFKQNKKIKKVVFPQGLTVIRDEAFNGCDGIEEIVFSNTIQTIGENAFKGCFKLSKIELPQSLEKIGEHCFEYCKSATSVTIPQGLKVISAKAFTNCEKLESVVISDGVEEIHENAFNECAFQEVVIPTSVKKIGKRAFARNQKLEKVIIADELKNGLDSSVFEGCSNASFTSGQASSASIVQETPIQETISKEEPKQKDESQKSEKKDSQPSAEPVQSISEKSLYTIKPLSDTTCSIINYSGKESKVRIPSEIEYCGKKYQVVEIGDLAFAKKKTEGKIVWTTNRANDLTEVSIEIIPSAVDPSYEGYQTIKEVVIPEGVKTIGKASFYSCVALEKIQLPKSLENIGEGVFAFCSKLRLVDLPSGITIIPDHAFEYCEGLESFCSKTVKEIKRDAFLCCRTLKNFSIPQNVIIGNNAFQGCSYMEKNRVSGEGEANMAMFKMKPIEGDTCAISGFEGEGDVVVPSEMQNNGKSYKVVKIANYAFSKQKKIKKVSLPDTIESIGGYAFTESSLTEIEIPSSVKEIGEYAFDDCKDLTKVEIPDGISKLSRHVFSKCVSLESIKIPDGIKVIPSSAFAGCRSLKHIDLPHDLESIEDGAFGCCSSLSNVDVTRVGRLADNAFYESKCVVENKNYMSLGGGCELTYYHANGTNVELPDEVYFDGKLCKVISIGNAVFSESKIEKIKLPAYLERIEMSAFSNCKSLTTVQIPSTLKEVGVMAFVSCSSLKEIDLPENTTIIKSKAFSGCENLERIAVPGVKEFGSRCFANCKNLKKIENLQNNVKMGEDALFNCKMLDMSGTQPISSSSVQIKVLDGSTCAVSGFSGIGDAIVPAEAEKDGKTYKVVRIGSYAFAKNKNINKVTLPDTIELIADYAFANSSLSEIDIPSSVKEIKSYAFDECKQLAKVTLHEGLETIDNTAFEDCSSLEKIVIPEGVKEINSGVFRGCTNLSEVVLPSSVNLIDSIAFRGCEHLKTINIMDTIVEIDSNAFSDTPFENLCRRFEILDDDTCSVGKYCMPGTVEVPSEVTIKDKKYKVVKVNNLAFQCENINKVILPDTIEVLDEYAFQHCDGLTEIVLPKNLKRIEEYCFYECSKLDNVILPKSLEFIGEYAFRNCVSLRNIQIEGDVEISETAFENTPYLDQKEEDLQTEIEEQKERIRQTEDQSAFVSQSADECFSEDDENEMPIGATAQEYFNLSAPFIEKNHIPSSLNPKGTIKSTEVGVGDDEGNDMDGDPISEWDYKTYDERQDLYRYYKYSNIEFAHKCLEKAAEMGHAESQYILGWSYLKGVGVDANFKKAFEYASKSVETGYVPALTLMGMYYDNAINPNYDSGKAVEFYKKAVDLDDPYAFFRLAMSYMEGKCVDADPSMANKLVTTSAEKGCSEAQMFLGIKYMGAGIYDAALKWLEKAAEQGEREAQWRLGSCYFYGNGVEKDYNTAIEWYKEATRNGSAIAPFELGKCYETGTGVTKNPSLAFKYYKIAADNGHSKAKFRLGLCYLYEQGVDEDYDKAVACFEEVTKECNDVDAQYYLGYCYSSQGLSGYEDDDKKAVLWLTKAVEQNHIMAHYFLALHYFSGVGVRKNMEKAVELFTIAAKANEASSQYYLAICYSQGKGVEENLRTAVSWCEKSAANKCEEAIGYLESLKSMLPYSEYTELSEEERKKILETTDIQECYSNGMGYISGAVRNYKKAFPWFKKAAACGDATSQYFIGSFYETGKGIHPDLRKAKEWYQKAIDNGSSEAEIAMSNLCAEEDEDDSDTLDDSTFGNLVHNGLNCWIGYERNSFFGEEEDLEIEVEGNADEAITPNQQKAYVKYLKEKDNLFSEFSKLLLGVYLGSDEKADEMMNQGTKIVVQTVVPKKLFVDRDGNFGWICSTEWDESNIGVLLSEEKIYLMSEEKLRNYRNETKVKDDQMGILFPSYVGFENIIIARVAGDIRTFRLVLSSYKKKVGDRHKKAYQKFLEMRPTFWEEIKDVTLEYYLDNYEEFEEYLEIPNALKKEKVTRDSVLNILEFTKLYIDEGGRIAWFCESPTAEEDGLAFEFTNGEIALIYQNEII